MEEKEDNKILDEFKKYIRSNEFLMDDKFCDKILYGSGDLKDSWEEVVQLIKRKIKKKIKELEKTNEKQR